MVCTRRTNNITQACTHARARMRTNTHTHTHTHTRHIVARTGSHTGTRAHTHWAEIAAGIHEDGEEILACGPTRHSLCFRSPPSLPLFLSPVPTPLRLPYGPCLLSSHAHRSAYARDWAGALRPLPFLSSSLFALLSKEMLRYDTLKRVTAKNAITHRFFDDLPEKDVI